MGFSGLLNYIKALVFYRIQCIWRFNTYQYAGPETLHHAAQTVFM